MHKGYQPHKEAVTEMDNKGRVSPTPEKMYVRNPNPRPIDGILIHKLPVDQKAKEFGRKDVQRRIQLFVCEEMEVKVPYYPVPHTIAATR